MLNQLFYNRFIELKYAPHNPHKVHRAVISLAL